MNNLKELLLTINVGIALYFLLTVPHFIYVYTWGNYGISYTFPIILILALTSGLLSRYIAKKIVSVN
jgi:hypothetical protein